MTAGRTAERRLAIDGAVYTVGLMLQRGLSFLLLPLATRVMDPDELGLATAGLAVGSFLAMVYAVGLNFSIVRLYYEEPADAARTHWAMLVRAQLLIAAALAALTWASGQWWVEVFSDVEWGRAMQVAVLFGLAQAAQSTAQGVLRASRRAVAFSAVAVSQVAIGGALAIVLADRHGAAGFLGGLAIGAGIAAVVGVAATYRRPKWSWTALRAALLLSGPFLLHMLAGWVLSLSDRVIVERNLGLEDLAAYHLAYTVSFAPMLLMDAAQAAWVPHFYGSLTTAQKHALPRRITASLTVLVALAAGLVVLASPAIGSVLAPDDYDFPLAVVAITVWSTFVRVAYLIGFAVVSDAKRSGPIARGSSAGAAANLVLNIALVPHFGLVAAASTTVVAYVIMSAVVVRASESVTGSPLDLRRLAVIWVVAATGVGALAALPVGVLGWSLRALAGAVLVTAGLVTLRRVRDGYRAALADAPDHDRPTTTQEAR